MKQPSMVRAECELNPSSLSCLLKYGIIVSIFCGITPAASTRDKFTSSLPVPPSRVSARLGSTVTLNCNISDSLIQNFSSEHLLTWKKRNKDMPLLLRFNGYPPHIEEQYQGRLQLIGSSDLQLSDIQTSDEGWYDCSLVYPEGRPDGETLKGSWVHLSVQVPPQLTKLSPSLVVGRLGETIDLFCHASGVPQPEIRWLKNGKEVATVPLANSNNINNNLINNIYINDDLSTKHVHTLIDDSNLGRKVIRNMKHLRNIRSETNNNHNLNNNVGTYDIYHHNNNNYNNDNNNNNVEIVNNEVRKALMYDYNLQIPNLEREDSASYVCLLSNPAGNAQHIIRLLVEDSNWTYSGSAHITVPPNNMTFIEGSRVKLPCHAEGVPSTITYNWFKDDVSVHKIPSLIARSGLYADGSLVIKSLMKEDMGWYKCQTFNGVGHPSEAAAFLNVTYLPRVVPSDQKNQHSTKIYLARGLTGKVVCTVDANPPASIIMWYKNDQVLAPTKNHRVRVSKHGSLVIEDIIDSDEGVYTCLPYSPLGSGNKSEPFQVFVRDPPFFKTTPEIFYYKRLGDTVVMSCSVGGDPKPSVLWQKTEGPFPPSTRTLLDNETLTIVNLNWSDSGVYECVGISPVVFIIASSVLTIKNESHPAEEVNVILDQDSAVVSWLPAFHAGQPLHYLIWYQTTTNKNIEWQTMPVFPSNASQVTLHGLPQNADFFFAVSATTPDGSMLFSKLKTFSNKDESQTRLTPTKVHPAFDNRDNITDKEMITGSNGEGDDDNEDDDSEDEDEEDDGNDENAEARLLPPTNLDVYQTRTGLNITWQHPLSPPDLIYSDRRRSRLLPARYYLVQAKTIGSWTTISQRTPANTTHYLWTTAPRGASYSFRIFSINEPWQSNASQIFTLKTDVDLLPFVGPLTSSAVGGLMGLLVFLIFAVISSVIAFKYFVKWRQREKASSRYGNIKYTGPHQCDGALKSQEHNHIEIGNCVLKENTDIILTPTSIDFEREERTIKETPI